MTEEQMIEAMARAIDPTGFCMGPGLFVTPAQLQEKRDTAYGIAALRRCGRTQPKYALERMPKTHSILN